MNFPRMLSFLCTVNFAAAVPGWSLSHEVLDKKVRLVDLTWSYDSQTLYWPTAPSSFSLKSLFSGKTKEGFFYSANSFCTPEHGGTHLDAPVHFSEKGWTTDQIPLEKLVTPLLVIDISAKSKKNPDYRLTPEDITSFEQKNGKIARNSTVMIFTGWGAKWPVKKLYFGDDAPHSAANLHFPSFGEASVQLLIKERGIAALGTDTPSIDYGPSKMFPVHRVAAAYNIPAFENVAHVEKLPSQGAWLLALPMKIGGGSGGPVRLVAMIPGA